MGNYLHKFLTNSEFSSVYWGDEYLEPWVSLTEENEKCNYNRTFDNAYLTFEILTDGTVYWKDRQSGSVHHSIDYSINNDAWQTITSSKDGASFSVKAGDKVRFKGTETAYSNSTSSGGNCSYFSGTSCRFDVYGNILSLFYGDAFADKTNFPHSAYSPCKYLFSGSSIVNAENLILPTTVPTNYCYQYMFSGCNSLTKSPKLPATELTDYCYSGMFRNCRSLTVPPELPAKTLSSYCYEGMFYWCTSLVTPPKLPATTLAESCYYNMFIACNKLVLPNDFSLPAVNLEYSCYRDMFHGCSSITTLPMLPAQTLSSTCYAGMFYGTGITSIPEGYLHATTLAEYCYKEMFTHCIGLTQLSPNLLPATTLAAYCYDGMFEECTGLTSLPSELLPATTLSDYCYQRMFNLCTGLTSLPSGLLQATTLATYCYNYMFSQCTGLTSIPNNFLPVTTLKPGCYGHMFNACTGLTEVPSNLLPATTLNYTCYEYMFSNCTSLVSAPILPATTEYQSAYVYMFDGCSSLNYVKAMLTYISNSNNSNMCTYKWLQGVSETGTFVKNASASWNITGPNGIPSGWTVITE